MKNPMTKALFKKEVLAIGSLIDEASERLKKIGERFPDTGIAMVVIIEFLDAIVRGLKKGAKAIR